MKDRLINIIKETFEGCIRKGLLKDIPLPEFVLEVPNNQNHGHFATNLPLLLAAGQKSAPRQIADIMTSNMDDAKGILEKTEVAGPGFINFWIKDEQWHRLLSDIVTGDESFGGSFIGNGKRVMVEFVSANPTGPLHLGHGRGAALGDTLSRILSFCGYDVAREFYINDAGLQIRLLGESVFSRYMQIDEPEFPFPENGYHGEYVSELAEDISRQYDLKKMSRDEAVELCSSKGKEILLSRLKDDLSGFRVSFDRWYSESELHESGFLRNTLDEIETKGHLYEKDQALWIDTSRFGDDKDRVIRKKDGFFTYFASDIAYHLDKNARGYGWAINLWGADHHGYIPRMKAALSACGLDQDWLSVILIQLVKLWKGGQEIKMSKRAGTYVTLKELCEEVGVDAVRFVFLSKNSDSPLDFDIDLVKRRDSENPVYYVQYAHARICSIFRKAEAEGIGLPEVPFKVLKHIRLEEEMALLRTMAAFPLLLQEICLKLEPHRLTYYLTELAASFHRYFNLGTKHPEHRIISEDVEKSEARLVLAQAVRIVIANGLNLLGIKSPERM